MKTRRSYYLLGLLLLILLPLDVTASKLFDKVAKKQFTGYLDEICQWILSAEAGGGSFKNLKEDEGSLAVGGNLARVLVAGFELTKNNSRYLEAALRWCDSFASQQQRVQTSKGNEGGYWASQGGKGTIDLSDDSVAAAALARASVYADGQRKHTYSQALERYARFLMEGCKDDPLGKNRGATKGWILSEGNDKGAIGRGYTQDRAAAKPSTVSTATGAAFFGGLYAMTKNKQYREMALENAHWILRVRKPNGEIPFLQDGEESDEWPLNAVAVSGEGLLAAVHLLEDPNLSQQIAKEIEPTIRWLVRTQNDQGLWGEGSDQKLSSGVVTLMAWFYLNGTHDEAIPQSLEKFWQVLLNPVHSQSFGVQVSGHTTGLVGLTTAEMIKPGITFKRI